MFMIVLFSKLLFSKSGCLLGLDLLALAESFHRRGAKLWSKNRIKLCCFSLSVGAVTLQEAHTKLQAGTMKLQKIYKIVCRLIILQETYSRNSFIRNWIIRKSRLTGKLTQLKFTVNRPWTPRGGIEVHLYSFLNTALDWSRFSTPRPVRFIPEYETQCPLHRRLDGPQGRSGRIRIFLPHRNSIPGRPARTEFLYRIRYPSPQTNILMPGKLLYPATPFYRSSKMK